MRPRTCIKVTLVITAVIASSGLFSACGPAEKPLADLSEGWNLANNPSVFGVFSGVRYDAIPNEGRLLKRPWSGSYWPTYKGGISHRWQKPVKPDGQSKDYRDYLYAIPNQTTLASMNEARLSQLSPAEKFDLAMGHENLPLTRSERAKTLASVRGDGIPLWFGDCDGWATAAYLEEPPGNVAYTYTNDGRKIAFYSGDIKSLFAKAYASAETPVRYLGNRCHDDQVRRDSNGRILDPSCRDINAGAFHLVVPHMIANLQQSFVVELDRGSFIWNHPVVGYKFRYSKFRTLDSADRRAQYRAPGTTHLVNVDFYIEYANSLLPARSPVETKIHKEHYYYSLELNQNGQIIGGEWFSHNRPDFLWRRDGRPQGEVDGIDLAFVRGLRDQSLGLVPVPVPVPRPDPMPDPTPVPTPFPIGTVPALSIEHVTIDPLGARHTRAHIWGLVRGRGQFVVRMIAARRLGRVVRHTERVTGGVPFQFDAPVANNRTLSLLFELIGPQGVRLDQVEHPLR